MEEEEPQGSREAHDRARQRGVEDRVVGLIRAAEISHSPAQCWNTQGGSESIFQVKQKLIRKWSLL